MNSGIHTISRLAVNLGSASEGFSLLVIFGKGDVCGNPAGSVAYLVTMPQLALDTLLEFEIYIRTRRTA